MPKYRTYNWPQIFAEFDQSDLSQTEFCRSHDLNLKYFNLKLSKRKTQAGTFANVVVEPASVSPQGIILEVGACKVHCSNNMPMSSVVALVKALL